MENNNTTAEVLNDLGAILNDRVEGYEKAIEELKGEEADLVTLFSGYVAQSQNLKSELDARVTALGSEQETDTTARGKVYRVWMDVKAAFTGGDRHAVLASCEYGEDAAQKAYRSALEDDSLSGEDRTLVQKQQQELRTAHDKVKALRDSVTA